MDYNFSAEQIMLQDSLAGWLGRDYNYETWRKIIAQDRPFSARNWAGFAEMGWLGVSIPEDYGGMGFGAFETGQIAEAFGAALVVEPMMSTAILGAGLVLGAGSQTQKANLLPAIVAGELRLAAALGEKTARYDYAHGTTHAKASGGGYVLNGEKTMVLDAPVANKVLVLARSAAESGNAEGQSLFLVDTAAEGLTMQSYATVDDRSAAELVFHNTPAQAMIGDPGQAMPTVTAALDHATIYLCSEGVGVMQRVLDQTLDYLKNRSQFGQPLAEFQVLQHRIVDLRVALEQARAMALYASANAGADQTTRSKAVSAAKVAVGKAARLIGRDAVQLHGGMGMTNELIIGQYFKRLIVVETLFGDIAYHKKRFASFA